MTVPDSFETARLAARRIGVEHLPLLERMHGDACVMASIGGVRSSDETRKYLEENVDHWVRYGYGLWVLFNAAGDSFAGRGGIRQVVVPGGEETEIAYAFMSEYWRRGLASELAHHLVTIAFENLDIASLVAFTWTSNIASERVMQKLGLRYDRHFDYRGRRHVQYRVRREDWHAAA